MVEMKSIIFLLKGIILTTVLTRAVREWGIFDKPREWIKSKSNYIRRLLDCYECSAFWVAFFVIFYLFYFEWYIFTYALIFQWVACWAQIFYEVVDAERANREQDFQNKIKGK
jgi:hypothetical protein